MDRRTSLPIRLHVWGENALFTRPEFSVERVSYDVITPSAARAIFEAVFWKPEIRWFITQIDVLKPIKFASIRRNEIKSKAAMRPALSAVKGNNLEAAHLGINIDEDRTQRASLLLKDVSYLLHGRISLVDGALPDEALIKYIQMFTRRAEAGQYYSAPYLGCKEFPAFFEYVPDGAERQYVPINVDKDLGWLLFDTYDEKKQPNSRFFRGEMKRGIIKVPHPASAEVWA
jgi:CRISPR-associated protein Cas5d